MKKVTVGVFCPIVDDPTSWYRGWGPWSRLAQSNPDVDLVLISGPSWAHLIGLDILVMQRPCTPEHFGLLHVAKDLGVKVWCDMDDDNLSVPKDNPTYAQYNNMAIKEALLNLARNCDVLTVTTKFLHKKYGIYNKNCKILPNAIDDNLLKHRHLPNGPREKKFFWRGTLSHQRNLMSVGQQLLNLSGKHPDWRFVFFGCDPIDLTDRIRNHEFIPQCSITDFYKVMQMSHSTILYYPLNANDHSQARSHISWLEGTYGNMAVLAYGNDEFKRPGCLNYTSQMGFEEVLDSVVQGAVDIDKCVEESWNEIQEKYLLSKTNKTRLEIIESLL